MPASLPRHTTRWPPQFPHTSEFGGSALKQLIQQLYLIAIPNKRVGHVLPFGATLLFIFALKRWGIQTEIHSLRAKPVSYHCQPNGNDIGRWSDASRLLKEVLDEVL